MPSLIASAQFFPPDSLDVNKILNYVSNVDGALATYDTVMRYDYEHSTDGGEIIGYYQAGEICKITTHYFGETGQAKHEYYAKNKHLIYLKVTETNYNRPYYWDEKKAQELGDDEAFDMEKSKIDVQEYGFKEGYAFLIIRAENSYKYYRLSGLISWELYDNFSEYTEFLSEP